MKLKHTRLKQHMLFQVFLLISEKYPNSSLFEERNLVFFPTQHPHVALPLLIIPHWLSLSPSLSFSIVSWNLSHRYAIFSHCFITIHPQYSSLLFQLHGHHFRHPIIICYHHSKLSHHCSHHFVLFPSSYHHAIVMLFQASHC